MALKKIVPTWDNPGLTELKSKSLYDWCTENGEYGQKLIKEYSKKNKIAIHKIARSSNKDVTWECSVCGTEWHITVSERTGKNKRKCPECVKKKKLESSLGTFMDNNKDIGKKLKQEFSSKNAINPYEVGHRSNKVVTWKCSTCGYEWNAMISSRTNGSNCPACVNQVVIPERNTFKFWCETHGDYGKRMLSEFSSKNEFGPDEITLGTSKIVLWECSTCRYEWTAPVRNRTRDNFTGCPACSGRVAILGKNTFLDWCNENGEYGKQLLNEYMDKNEYAPDKITAKNTNKVWWHCSFCEKEWEAYLRNRTSMKAGCPYCQRIGTSLGEQIIYYLLKRELPQYEVMNRYKFSGKYEIDIYIPKLKFGIEYSGFIWHKSDQLLERDRNKRNVFIENELDVQYILEYCDSEREDIYKMYYDHAFERQVTGINIESAAKYIQDYLLGKYNINIDISLTGEELAQCREKSSNKERLELEDTVLRLHKEEKSVKEISEITAKNEDIIRNILRKLRDIDKLPRDEELAEKIRAGQIKGKEVGNLEVLILHKMTGFSLRKMSDTFNMNFNSIKRRIKEAEQIYSVDSLYGITQSFKMGIPLDELVTDLELDLETIKQAYDIYQKYELWKY